MSKLYICDRCGKKISGDTRYGIVVIKKTDERVSENWALKERDLCEGCIVYVADHIFLMEEAVQNITDFQLDKMNQGV